MNEDQNQKATAFVADFYDVSEDDARANYADEIEAALKLSKQADCYGDGNIYRGERSRDSQVKTVWVGLTDEELPKGTTHEFDRGVRWAEAKLKEKNT